MTSGVVALAKAAKKASRALSVQNTGTKDTALDAIANALEQHAASILAANAQDLKSAELLVASGELSGALFQRLILTEGKLRSMMQGVRAVRDLPDPAGRTLARTLLDDGLVLEKISCPLGVLAVIFEARPDAITQISALAIKSGNAVILKGGKEVEQTMRAILDVIRGALKAAGSIPEDVVTGVYGREAVATLLQLDNVIDLVIPRGSNALVQHIQQHTRIPVLGHADGVCHVYIDAAANPAMAIPIVIDSKIQYPAACNAVETVLIHRTIAPQILPELTRALQDNGVRVRGSETARALAPNLGIEPMTDDEWHTEYSDLIVAIGVVDSFEEALDHIERYGSHHTDAIVTEDQHAAQRFLSEVDSANVYLNCSTRFSDGYRYGFGAEVGISTSKLHARGPVGLEGLVTYKYRMTGSGQVVRDYSGPTARPFLHVALDAEPDLEHDKDPALPRLE